MANRQLISVNPATEQPIDEVACVDPASIPQRVLHARSAGKRWAALELSERCNTMLKLADIVEERAEELAQLVTREMGKVISEARGEVIDAAGRIRYFAELAPPVLAPRETVVGGVRGIVEQAPMGVVAAIKPWNFPVSIPLWTMVPALLCGNAVMFKPSELTPLIGARLVELFYQAGVPEAVLPLLQGHELVGRALVDADVNMIGFVGSMAAGISIMKNSAPGLKRLTLELGGKDPMLVLADANLERAAEGAVRGAFKNCGQVCCSVERVYVEQPLYREFLELVCQKAGELRIGPGDDSNSQLGPMVAETERERVLQLVSETVAAGARLCQGGQALDRRGYFITPAIFTDVPADARMSQRENFGPLLQIEAVADAEEAILRANALPYGLTASVWSEDIERATAIARRLDAGTRAVNQNIGSMVQFPWGGRKKSGIGRMLSHEGLIKYAEPVTLRLPFEG